eukprot:GEMP01032043.1.p1 GENE.GEMP01032043.1~~GEMP01032043.1.p1  ORF type:complete len:476 (+),score=81.80 GEMP01032043.1:46-1473(+)
MSRRPPSGFFTSGLHGYKKLTRLDAARNPLPTRAAPTSIESIPHPREMDCSLIGQAAAVAARERFTSPQFWTLLCERARQLAPHFEAQDIALLLNGMTRLQIQDAELVDLLIPRVEDKMVFFNSTYLSMTLAALGKLPHSGCAPAFLEQISKELLGRIYEFYSPTEISMVVNALVRLEVKNARLFTRFAEHCSARMTMDSFHVRDLSVIAHAFSRAQWPDDSVVGQRPRKDVLNDLFGRICTELERTLDEATPQELARLVTAFAKAEVQAFERIFPACLKAAREQVIFMTPKQVSTAAFAFGEVLEIAPRECVAELHQLFKVFEKTGLRSMHLFALEDIISFLTSYARWHLNFDQQTLASFLRRATTLARDTSTANARNLIVSVSVLVQRNCREVPSEATLLAQNMARPAFQKVDASSIVKLVGALEKLQVPTEQWIGFVKQAVATDFSLGSRALYERLKDCGVDVDDDVMLALQ